MDKYALNSTMRYYDENAERYFNNTVCIDMSLLYYEFLNSIPAGCKILDVGCGSGRDSKYFIEKGFTVISIDASKELCDKASKYLGREVIHTDLLEIEYDSEFGGVWACASLLHIPHDNQRNALVKLFDALVNDGIFYASYKYGDKDCFDGDRYFCNQTEESLHELFNEIVEAQIIKIWNTDDNKMHSQDKWINILCKKEKESK